MPYNRVFASTLYSEDWLRQVYVEEGRNAAQVAKLIGCTRQAVHGALRRFGIPIKGLSEAQKVATAHPGSDAPRPRYAFAETLHNRNWMQGQIGRGAPLTEMAEAAGCSPSAFLRALERMGLADRWRALRQTLTAARREAREPKREARPSSQHVLPPGPCALCDARGFSVEHKDGDETNNAPSNVERLCQLHRRKQRHEEMLTAFAVLAAMGIPRSRIYNEARRRLLIKEGNMARDKVSASDSVSVGLERTPSTKVEEATRFCPKCGSIAVKHASAPGKLLCIDPACGFAFPTV